MQYAITIILVANTHKILNAPVYVHLIVISLILKTSFQSGYIYYPLLHKEKKWGLESLNNFPQIQKELQVCPLTNKVYKATLDPQAQVYR